MRHEVKNVFIAGGTGFLGYYSALMFLKKGCSVSTISLPDEINLGDWYPKEINLSFGDLFKMSENEIFENLNGNNYDTFIYCLGPDDRITPPAPAYDYFHLRLVDHCLRICTAVKMAGIKRCVILNSYFSYFDRQSNGQFSKYHPYIKCRVEQAKAITEIGEDGVFDVMILELPYIFGSMPEREPIWGSVFLDRFKKMPAAFFPDGGTAAIHVTGVAEAVFAAACNGENGSRYPVNSTNIKYKDMINAMMLYAGLKRKFIKIPKWIAYLTGFILLIKDKLSGSQGGLYYPKLMSQILSKDLFIDPIETYERLNYQEYDFKGGDDVYEGIKEAMQKLV